MPDQREIPAALVDQLWKKYLQQIPPPPATETPRYGTNPAPATVRPERRQTPSGERSELTLR